MIEFITKSKIRQRIILLFLYNQDKEYYLSEIARKVCTTPGTARRELQRLLQNDFLYLRKKANLSVYHVNKSFSILEEIESIVKKTIGIEIMLQEGLRNVKGIKFAFLFGSYVKGDFKSSSDIDLFILGDFNEKDVFKVVQKIEDQIGKEINYHIADEEDFLGKLETSSFYKDIIHNIAIVKGDQDEFKRFVGKAD